MKRKEITKFLALMMCVAMVTGSGVPVTAADFSSDEAVVETVTEDEPDVEIANDDDTDAGIVSADENEEYADADETGVDVADLFTDEDDAADVGEETQQGISFKAKLNDGVEVDSVTSTTTDKLGSKTWTQIDITFKAADLRDSDNKISLTPSYGENIESVTIGAKRSPKGVTNSYTPNDDKVYEITGLTTVDNGESYCSFNRNGSPEYYKIVYHVVSAPDLLKSIQLTGNLVNGTTAGTEKTTRVEKTSGIYFGNLDTVDQVAQLTFENSEVDKDVDHSVKFAIAHADGSTVTVGTKVTDKIEGVLEPDSEGNYSVDLGRETGPAAKKVNLYCSITKDSETKYFVIKLIRKGYADIVFRQAYDENYPLKAFSGYDSEKKVFTGSPISQMLPWINFVGTIYDKDGNPTQSTDGLALEVNPKYKDDIYTENSVLYSKKAGGWTDGLLLRYAGKE